MRERRRSGFGLTTPTRWTCSVRRSPACAVWWPPKTLRLSRGRTAAFASSRPVRSIFFLEKGGGGGTCDSNGFPSWRSGSENEGNHAFCISLSYDSLFLFRFVLQPAIHTLTGGLGPTTGRWPAPISTTPRSAPRFRRSAWAPPPSAWLPRTAAPTAGQSRVLRTGTRTHQTTLLAAMVGVRGAGPRVVAAAVVDGNRSTHRPSGPRVGSRKPCGGPPNSAPWRCVREVCVCVCVCVYV